MSPVSPNLPQEVHLLQAGLCSALADGTRILLIYALANRPHNVTELMNALSLPQSTVSRHLKVLREQGLVGMVRQGQSIEYSLADRRLIETLEILREVLRDNLTRRALLVSEQETL